MSYNSKNYLKKLGFIISVYNLYKTQDVPDTKIINEYFPTHNIHLNYRQWMNIKGMVVPKEYIVNGKIITQYEKIVNTFKTEDISILK